MRTDGDEPRPPINPHDAQQGVMDLFEANSATYLDDARAIMQAEYRRTRTPLTTDDVWRLCPPPEDKDPRVLGSIFRGKGWKATGEFVASGRGHARKIQRFVFRCAAG